MSDDDKANKEQAERLLNEALSGTSGKSKNTLIREALKALGNIK